MTKGFVIALDGPAASGKGTLAPLLAQKLNGYHLYTGSMYRCVTLYCLENSIHVEKEEEVKKALIDITISFKEDRILLNNEDVTERIRQRDVDNNVSTVSDYTCVREFLRIEQQRIGEKILQNGKVVIAEGRDTATKVFSNAEVKIYLTASADIRARRRYEQLKQLGVKASYDEILEETISRDERDMHGSLHYLVDNPKEYGYYVLDDSVQTKEETLNQIINLLKERKLLK
jgi:CMP/dCMP kinase